MPQIKITRQTENFYLIFSLLVVTIIGLSLKFYSGWGRQWLNDYAAAIFYEIFWCLFAYWFFSSRKTPNYIPIWVFIVTCILEFLQLWHPLLLELIRATLVGKLLLGTTFVWWDFPHYLVGSFMGWIWLRQLPRMSNRY